MNYDIFISYSRHDSDVVNEIVTLLEQEGYFVWIDRDGIESGEDFKEKIARAIKESSVVLFFSSEHSNVSGWTAKEIGIAVKYKKHIIPILLDNSSFNETVEFDLINLDFVDYSKASTRKAIWEKLLRTLRNKIGNGSKEIERLEAERKAKEEAKRARLEKERLERIETERKAKEADKRERLEHERKAEEARWKAEQESLERERADVQCKANLEPANQDKSNSKPKKVLRIGLGAIAVVAFVLLLTWPKKTESINNESDKSAVTTQQQPSMIGSYNGHECVDLGLPSGTLWATCNVGADSPEDIGESYMLSEEDVAMVNWGSGWYTPSKEQLEELMQYTTNQWTAQNGVKGELFTAKNGKTLFLPSIDFCRFWYSDTFYDDIDTCGLYGAKSFGYHNKENRAWCLLFDSFSCYITGLSKYNGCLVRPVRQR